MRAMCFCWCVQEKVNEKNDGIVMEFTRNSEREADRRTTILRGKNLIV